MSEKMMYIEWRRSEMNARCLTCPHYRYARERTEEECGEVSYTFFNYCSLGQSIYIKPCPIMQPESELEEEIQDD